MLTKKFGNDRSVAKNVTSILAKPFFNVIFYLFRKENHIVSVKHDKFCNKVSEYVRNFNMGEGMNLQ